MIKKLKFLEKLYNLEYISNNLEHSLWNHDLESRSSKAANLF
jgi:hypothetical protein